MDAILQTTFSNVFFQMKVLEFLLKFNMKFVLIGPIDSKPALDKIMACHFTDDKP